jgi:hypothetical protein
MEAQVQDGRIEVVGEDYRGVGVNDFKAGDRVKLRECAGTYRFVSYLDHCANKWAYVRLDYNRLLCVMTMDLKPSNPGRQDEGGA